MSENDRILKKKLKYYYQNIFQPFELIESVGKDHINCLEIGAFTFPHPIYDEQGVAIPNETKSDSIRKHFFEDPMQIGNWLGELISFDQLRGPAYTAYYGAKFMTPIKESDKIETAIWRSKDFIIDIDGDSSIKIRHNQCQCVGKNICNHCLRLLLEATSNAIITLDEDFGFSKENVSVYFSGREGIHIHYPLLSNFDKYGNENKERELRRLIIEYMQFCVEEIKKDSKKKKENALPEDYEFRLIKPIAPIPFPIKSDNMYKRIVNTTALYYFQQTPIEKLLEAEWFDTYDRKYLDIPLLKSFLIKLKNDTNAYITSKANKNNILLNPFDKVLKPASFHTKYKLNYYRTLENILKYRYPRYDARISYDTRRIFKLPRSIDARTSKCYVIQKIPIKSILNFSFTLDQLETLDSVLQQNHQ